MVLALGGGGSVGRLGCGSHFRRTHTFGRWCVFVWLTATFTEIKFYYFHIPLHFIKWWAGQPTFRVTDPPSLTPIVGVQKIFRTKTRNGVVSLPVLSSHTRGIARLSHHKGYQDQAAVSAWENFWNQSTFLSSLPRNRTRFLKIKCEHFHWSIN